MGQVWPIRVFSALHTESCFEMQAEAAVMMSLTKEVHVA